MLSQIDVFSSATFFTRLYSAVVSCLVNATSLIIIPLKYLTILWTDWKSRYFRMLTN